MKSEGCELELPLTRIAIADSALLEEGIEHQEVIVARGGGQGLDILGRLIELLEGS